MVAITNYSDPADSQTQSDQTSPSPPSNPPDTAWPWSWLAVGRFAKESSSTTSEEQPPPGAPVHPVCLQIDKLLRPRLAALDRLIQAVEDSNDIYTQFKTKLNRIRSKVANLLLGPPFHTDDASLHPRWHDLHEVLFWQDHFRTLIDTPPIKPRRWAKVELLQPDGEYLKGWGQRWIQVDCDAGETAAQGAGRANGEPPTSPARLIWLYPPGNNSAWFAGYTLLYAPASTDAEGENNNPRPTGCARVRQHLPPAKVIYDDLQAAYKRIFQDRGDELARREERIEEAYDEIMAPHNWTDLWEETNNRTQYN